jgi:nucleotide-binding universal stress UspA family protein
MITPKTKSPMKILLADDGSQHSLAAVALIRDLSLQPESLVTALGVLTPRNAASHMVLESALEQTHSLLQEAGLQVVTEMLLGYPAEVITNYSAQYNPDLIILGAKGLRATLGILLGGVAQQVVEYSRWPVLVVRAPYNGLRHILLVTDGSIYSQQALDYLGQFLIFAEAEVSVMHVLPPLPSPEYVIRAWTSGSDVIPIVPAQEVEQAIAEQVKEEERAGQELLDNALHTLEAAGIKAKSALVHGDAATEIIEYAKDQHVDLIVSGSRGLSQVKGWLLGSVSRKLVHYANCSVLIVRGVPEKVD